MAGVPIDDAINNVLKCLVFYDTSWVYEKMCYKIIVPNLQLIY